MSLPPSDRTDTRDRCSALAAACLTVLVLAALGCDSPTYTQAQQDGDVALGLAQGIDRLFLTKLAALAPGAVDLTTNCGTDGTDGTVRAEGSYSRRTDGWLQSRDLLYSFSTCHFSAVSTLSGMTLTGELREVASYTQANGVWNSKTTYASSQLAVSGSGMGLPGEDEAPVPFTVDERGPVALTKTTTGGTTRMTGSLFDRTVDATNTPSGGSGGGGGDSCTTTAQGAGCCTTSGGIERVGFTVPANCECPPGTCFLGLDRIYDVNMCGCSACGGCT